MRGPNEMLDLYGALAPTDNVTYVLDADHRIIRTNAAWDRFARDNGGDDLLARWKRGTPLFEVIPKALRPFYLRGFADAVSTQRHWDHEYECSSPTMFRKFCMTTYPFSGSFVVSHALIVEHPHTEEPHPASAGYQRDGLITMCCHCRRVRGDKARWDWVPAYVEQMPANTSHGLCPGCASYYDAA